MLKFKTRKDAEMNDRINEVKHKTEVADITFVVMAENGTIDEITATEHINVFSSWAEGIAYTIGNLRTYENVLYKCIQAHTSQADWTPDKTPALWTIAGNPAEEFPAWSQPYGSEDAYLLGAKVSYAEKHWVSSIANNIWVPGVYGWTEVN